MSEATNFNDLLKEAMPLCGKCNNCKLVIWEGNLSIPIKNKYAFKLGDVKAYKDKLSEVEAKRAIILRCNWIKQPVEQPIFLLQCDGFRSAEEAAANY